MFEIVGLDIGNLTTVVVGEDQDIVFESRMANFTDIKALGSNEVFEFEGEKYVIEQGKFENELIKHTKENYLHLAFYGIAKVTREDRVKLVVGIPAGQYNTKKDELKELFKKNNLKKITIGLGKEAITRNIFIEDVLVVPESYGVKAIGAMRECKSNIKTYVIDIGGGTTDIAEFDEQGNFIDGESIDTGLLDLYRDTRKVLKNNYNCNASLEESKKYFDGDLELINGDEEYKKPLLLTTIKKIINELRGLYSNLGQSNIVVAGGGAKKSQSIFKKIYPQSVAVTDVKANAKGFRNVGVKTWVKK